MGGGIKRQDGWMFREPDRIVMYLVSTSFKFESIRMMIVASNCISPVMGKPVSTHERLKRHEWMQSSVISV